MSPRRPSIARGLVLIAVLAGGPARAAAPLPPAVVAEPVLDIETTDQAWPSPYCTVICPPNYGALVHRMTTFGNQAYFSAFDFEHGLEPWVSDGTAAGTHLLIEICPGECHSLPGFWGELGGELLFGAWRGSGLSNRLFATDGVTVRQVDDVPVPRTLSEEGSTRVAGWIYFGYGPQVARTDGQVIEIASEFPDEGFAVPRRLFHIGSRVFAARDGHFGDVDDLWQIQPSMEEVLNVCGEADTLRNAAMLGGMAFFSATCIDGAPDLGSGFFRTDGTLAGTTRIFGLDDGFLLEVFATDLELYFVHCRADPGVGYRCGVWRTNGTTVGTSQLIDYREGLLRLQAVLADRYLFFNSVDGLRSLDLTSGYETAILGESARVIPNPSGGVAFLASADHWWLTRGTPLTTHHLLERGPCWDTVYGAAFLGDRGLFGARSTERGEDLWSVQLPAEAVDIPGIAAPGLLALASLLALLGMRFLARRRWS